MNLNRIRIGCAITVIIGLVYAGSGLVESLTQFGIGMAVASVAVIGYGLCDFIDSHRDEQLRRHRAEVWHRRDLEARRLERERSERFKVANVYEFPRDGIDR